MRLLAAFTLIFCCMLMPATAEARAAHDHAHHAHNEQAAPVSVPDASSSLALEDVARVAVTFAGQRASTVPCHGMTHQGMGDSCCPASIAIAEDTLQGAARGTVARRAVRLAVEWRDTIVDPPVPPPRG